MARLKAEATTFKLNGNGHGQLIASLLASLLGRKPFATLLIGFSAHTHKHCEKSNHKSWHLRFNKMQNYYMANEEDVVKNLIKM